jgi:predicted ATPase/DNA-binding SARP family transcriptional activator
MPRLTLRLLGPPLVELDGEPVHLGRHKAVALLAYLALTRGPHARDALATLLWSELDQSGARGQLRRTLSLLNRMLGEGWLDIDRETAAWAGNAEARIDVEILRERLAACAVHGHPPEQTRAECVPLLAGAVDLYRDGFLAGFTLPDAPAFDEWQFFEGEGLRDGVSDALQRLATWYGGLGEYESAIPYARKWLALDPLHEPAQRELMALYARSGQRAAALRQYGECERVLQEELGIPPSPETTALYAQIRAHPETGFLTEARLPHNLPAAAAPFVGRKEVLGQLTALLQDPRCRLVTLVGPGGIGKTRIALQWAADVVAQAPGDRFPDGVYFVPLAAVQTVEGVVSAVAGAIGLSAAAGMEPRRQLLVYLRGKRMLLVMDNVEQLIDSPRGEGDGHRRGEGMELLLEVLGAAPGVQLLVTSRMRLNASGEQVLVVPGMDYPAPDGTGLGQPVRSVLGYSAVQLYLQQARRVRPGYAPSDEALAKIGRICRMVEGMPLAIVLAAAWMDVLSPDEIAAELEKSMAFLRSELRDLPERHRSMVAAFDVSWHMLSEGERQAFAALSVFRGGCTREAVEVVAGAGLEILRALVRKSFLTRDQYERYQVHELLRQYGEDKLRERAEDWERARDRHCAYFAEYLAGHKDAFRKLGPGKARLEIDNICAAWHWMLDQGKLAECRQAIGGLQWFDEGPAWYSTRRPLLERTIALLRRAEPSRENRIALGMALCYLSTSFGKDPEHASALAREGHQILVELDARRELAEAKMFAVLAGMAEDDAHADRLLHEGLSLAQETDAPMEEAWALDLLGGRHAVRAILEGLPEEAWQWTYEAFARALEIFRRIGHRRGEAIMLWGQADYAHAKGQYTKARSLYEESLAMCRELDIRQWVLNTLRHSGNAALTAGDCAEARAYYQEDLEKARAWGDPVETRHALCGLGDVALATGAPREAAEFYRRALQAAIEIGGFSGVQRIALSMAKRSAQSGERARAAELLAFAYHVVETYAIYSWAEVGLAGGRELEQELQEALPPDAYAAAQERGWARDMEETLRELLAEMEEEVVRHGPEQDE